MVSDNSSSCTNLYYNFEAPTKQLNDDVKGISPRLSTLEKTSEEFSACKDDAEGSISNHTKSISNLEKDVGILNSRTTDLSDKLSNMEKRLEHLEEQYLELLDNFEIAKGLLQVHDKSLDST